MFLHTQVCRPQAEPPETPRMPFIVCCAQGNGGATVGRERYLPQFVPAPFIYGTVWPKATHQEPIMEHGAPGTQVHRYDQCSTVCTSKSHLRNVVSNAPQTSPAPTLPSASLVPRYAMAALGGRRPGGKGGRGGKGGKGGSSSPFRGANSRGTDDSVTLSCTVTYPFAPPGPYCPLVPPCN